MSPDEAPKGEIKYFFCEDGKETPINMPSMEPISAEQMLKEIEQNFINTVESARQPVPTHIVGSVDCKPKKIKDFVEDLKILIAAREKYRNHKIPWRKRMIRKAYHMRKAQHLYLIADVPAKDIEITFHYTSEKFKELMK